MVVGRRALGWTAAAVRAMSVVTLVASSALGALGAGFAIFERNKSTGALKQLGGKTGCITGDGASIAGARTCADSRALGYGYGMSVSPDGESVYEATDYRAGLAIYRREAIK